MPMPSTHQRGISESMNPTQQKARGMGSDRRHERTYSTPAPPPAPVQRSRAVPPVAPARGGQPYSPKVFTGNHPPKNSKPAPSRHSQPPPPPAPSRLPARPKPSPPPLSRQQVRPPSPPPSPVMSFAAPLPGRFPPNKPPQPPRPPQASAPTPPQPPFPGAFPKTPKEKPSPPPPAPVYPPAPRERPPPDAPKKRVLPPQFPLTPKERTFPAPFAHVSNHPRDLFPQPQMKFPEPLVLPADPLIQEFAGQPWGAEDLSGGRFLHPSSPYFQSRAPPPDLSFPPYPLFPAFPPRSDPPPPPPPHASSHAKAAPSRHHDRPSPKAPTFPSPAEHPRPHDVKGKGVAAGPPPTPPKPKPREVSTAPTPPASVRPPKQPTPVASSSKLTPTSSSKVFIALSNDTSEDDAASSGTKNQCNGTTGSGKRCTRIIVDPKGSPKRGQSPSPQTADGAGALDFLDGLLKWSEGDVIGSRNADGVTVPRFCFQHGKQAMAESGCFVNGKGGRGEWIEFEDWIRQDLPRATKILLRHEMARPVSEKDETGYIYVHEMVENKGQRNSPTTFLKLGRSVRPVARLSQWRTQCPSRSPIVRDIFPRSSSRGLSGAGVSGALHFAERGCRHHHRWERFILIEVAGRAAMEAEETGSPGGASPSEKGKGKKCADCDRVHVELFEVGARAYEEWVREVVERWMRWCGDVLE